MGHSNSTRKAGPARLVLRALLHTPQIPPDAKKLFWRGLYSQISRRRSGDELPLLNYGYAEEGESALGGADRFGLALYGAVAGAAELAGKDVLEVGCGRGGGAAYVADRFRPRTVTGVDLAGPAIRSCREQHRGPGLHFAVADAEDLPYPGEAFDAVLSVESSHCYPDMLRFLSEVHRVLRPDGLLLLADFRRTRREQDASGAGDGGQDVGELRRQLSAAGFRILEEEDITPKVVRALRLTSPETRATVAQRWPRPLQRYALEFSGVEGSAVYRAFAEGAQQYLRFVLAKE